MVQAAECLPEANPPGYGHGNVFCYEEENWSDVEYGAGTFAVFCRNCCGYCPVTEEEAANHGLVPGETGIPDPGPDPEPGDGSNTEYCLDCSELAVDWSQWKFFNTFLVTCMNCYSNYFPTYDELSSKVDMPLPDMGKVACPNCPDTVDFFFHYNVLSGNRMRCPSCSQYYEIAPEALREWKEFCLMDNVYEGYNPPGSGHNIFCVDEILWSSWMQEGEVYYVMCESCNSWMPTTEDALIEHGQIESDPEKWDICKSCTNKGIKSWDNWSLDYSFDSVTFVVICELCQTSNPYSYEELSEKVSTPLPDIREVSCPDCGRYCMLFWANDVKGNSLYCNDCSAYFNVDPGIIRKWKEWSMQPHFFDRNNPPGYGHNNLFCFEEMVWSSWMMEGDTYVALCGNCGIQVPVTKRELIEHGQIPDEDEEKRKRPMQCPLCMEYCQVWEWEFMVSDGAVFFYCPQCNDFTIENDGEEYFSTEIPDEGLDVFYPGYSEFPACLNCDNRNDCVCTYVRIALDVGHSLEDTGADLYGENETIVSNEYKYWRTAAKEIASKLDERLRTYDIMAPKDGNGRIYEYRYKIRVYNRGTANAYTSGANLVQNWQPNIAVSLHLNSTGSVVNKRFVPDPNTGGLEILYISGRERSERLAEYLIPGIHQVMENNLRGRQGHKALLSRSERGGTWCNILGLRKGATVLIEPGFASNINHDAKKLIDRKTELINGIVQGLENYVLYYYVYDLNSSDTF